MLSALAKMLSTLANGDLTLSMSAMAYGVCHAPPIFQQHYKQKILSTETQRCLKQIIISKSYNFVL